MTYQCLYGTPSDDTAAYSKQYCKQIDIEVMKHI